MSVPIVFLDIDGVLRSYSPSVPTLRQDGRILRMSYNSECVDALNTLTQYTGAEIVVSSTWRQGGIVYVRDVLSRWNVRGRVVSMTPLTYYPQYRNRGLEIAAWLATRATRGHSVRRFVILDDDNDMEPLCEHLVLTDPENGLTIAEIDKSLNILRDDIDAEDAA